MPELCVSYHAGRLSIATDESPPTAQDRYLHCPSKYLPVEGPFGDAPQPPPEDVRTTEGRTFRSRYDLIFPLPCDTNASTDGPHLQERRRVHRDHAQRGPVLHRAPAGGAHSAARDLRLGLVRLSEHAQAQGPEHSGPRGLRPVPVAGSDHRAGRTTGHASHRAGRRPELHPQAAEPVGFRNSLPQLPRPVRRLHPAQ